VAGAACQPGTVARRVLGCAFIVAVDAPPRRTSVDDRHDDDDASPSMRLVAVGDRGRAMCVRLFVAV